MEAHDDTRSSRWAGAPDAPRRSSAPETTTRRPGSDYAPTTADPGDDSAAATTDPGRNYRPTVADPDAVIAAIASRQHGVVARRQLFEAGVSSRMIEHRLKKGRLCGLYRGVYRVGPLRARHEREMAAVLACGETAVLSHGSAGAAWELLLCRNRVEVSVQGGRRAPGPGVLVHRVGELGGDETTQFEGMPITTPTRTLLDLAGSVGGRELEQALAKAERRKLVDRGDIEELLARYPRRSGTRALHAVLAAGTGPALTRSEAESRFLTLVRKARLDAPEANVPVAGYEVDFLWRRARLVVEIDGFAFHSSSGAFERDRQRDAELAAAGFNVVRVTWRQLTREPEALLVRLGQALVRGLGV